MFSFKISRIRISRQKLSSKEVFLIKNKLSINFSHSSKELCETWSLVGVKLRRNLFSNENLELIKKLQVNFLTLFAFTKKTLDCFVNKTKNLVF